MIPELHRDLSCTQPSSLPPNAECAFERRPSHPHSSRQPSIPATWFPPRIEMSSARSAEILCGSSYESARESESVGLRINHASPPAIALDHVRAICALALDDRSHKPILLLISYARGILADRSRKVNADRDRG